MRISQRLISRSWPTFRDARRTKRSHLMLSPMLYQFWFQEATLECEGGPCPLELEMLPWSLSFGFWAGNVILIILPVPHPTPTPTAFFCGIAITRAVSFFCPCLKYCLALLQDQVVFFSLDFFFWYFLFVCLFRCRHISFHFKLTAAWWTRVLGFCQDNVNTIIDLQRELSGFLFFQNVAGPLATNVGNYRAMYLSHNDQQTM